MMVDKGSQTLMASDTNIHAMLGQTGEKDAKGNPIYQTEAQGLAQINAIIANAYGEKPAGDLYDPLAKALHTTQDVATLAHFLQNWEGFGWNWQTVKHLVGDTLPSFSTIREAYDRSRDVFAQEPKPETALGNGALLGASAK